MEHPVIGEIIWQGPSTGDQQAWQIEVLASLLNAGPICQHAAQYIMDNGVEFTFGQQLASGAAWTVAGNIQLNSKNYSLKTASTDDAWMLSLIVHEAKHLEQGAPFSGVPLSVEGELEAWQTQYQAMVELANNGIGTAPRRGTHFYNIGHLPSNPTDRDLRVARSEMIAHQGGPLNYLVWVLPLRNEYRYKSVSVALIPGVGPLLVPVLQYYGVPWSK